MASPWARWRRARRDRAEVTDTIAQYITDRINDLIENHQLATDAPIPLDVIERIAQEARAEVLRPATETVRQTRDEQPHGDGPAPRG